MVALADIFESINPKYSLDESLLTYGVIVSKKKVNGVHIFIIGIDTHTQLGNTSDEYDLFYVCRLSDLDISRIASKLNLSDKSKTKIIQNNYNLGTMLYQVFTEAKIDRLLIAYECFGIKSIKDYRNNLKPLSDVIEMFNKTKKNE